MTVRGDKYFPMRDSWVKEHLQDLEVLEKLGWMFDHTGGGCTAMHLVKDGLELITTDNDLEIPSSIPWDEMGGLDEQVIMCLYPYPDGASEGRTYRESEGKIMSWQTLISKTALDWFTTLKDEADA